MEWLKDNLVIAALLGVVLGIIAKYVVRSMKAKDDQ